MSTFNEILIWAAIVCLSLISGLVMALIVAGTFDGERTKDFVGALVFGPAALITGFLIYRSVAW